MVRRCAVCDLCKRELREMVLFDGCWSKLMKVYYVDKDVLKDR